MQSRREFIGMAAAGAAGSFPLAVQKPKPEENDGRFPRERRDIITW